MPPSVCAATAIAAARSSGRTVGHVGDARHFLDFHVLDIDDFLRGGGGQPPQIFLKLDSESRASVLLDAHVGLRWREAAAGFPHLEDVRLGALDQQQGLVNLAAGEQAIEQEKLAFCRVLRRAPCEVPLQTRLDGGQCARTQRISPCSPPRHAPVGFLERRTPFSRITAVARHCRYRTGWYWVNALPSQPSILACSSELLTN